MAIPPPAMKAVETKKRQRADMAEEGREERTSLSGEEPAKGKRSWSAQLPEREGGRENALLVSSLLHRLRCS